MSKWSIARKGMRFISAHNSRVLRRKDVKAAQAAVTTASLASTMAAVAYGPASPESITARAAYTAARAARAALYRKHQYLSLSDRALIAIFGA